MTRKLSPLPLGDQPSRSSQASLPADDTEQMEETFVGAMTATPILDLDLQGESLSREVAEPRENRRIRAKRRLTDSIAVRPRRRSWLPVLLPLLLIIWFVAGVVLYSTCFTAKLAVQIDHRTDGK